MEIRICKPGEIDEGHLNQIIDLIIQGGQIKSDRLGIGILIQLADFIAYKLDNNLVICTATLKNQYPVYREKVFSLAGAQSAQLYAKELGYIVTHPNYENQGHCQELLESFFHKIKVSSIFATSRKPAMVHILSKFGFRQKGVLYNHDLMLLIYDPPVDPFLTESFPTVDLNSNYQLPTSNFQLL